ncbi:MAG: phytanoyl-CoA dioxygenase family protein [Acidimicrobiales bacterium]
MAALPGHGDVHTLLPRRRHRRSADQIGGDPALPRPYADQGARHGAAHPWHQDQPYYNVDGRQNASLWFPVDPVPRASTLEFIAGTHRGPWFMPRTFLDGRAAWFPEGSLEELPDFAADPERWRVIGWELEPGDAVFFDMATVPARPEYPPAATVGESSRSAFSATTWCTPLGPG